MQQLSSLAILLVVVFTSTCVSAQDTPAPKIIREQAVKQPRTQNAGGTLSQAEADKLRAKNDKFLETAKRAQPVLNKTLAREEKVLAAAMESLQTAVQSKDEGKISNLIQQVNTASARVQALHNASADLAILQSVSNKMAKALLTPGDPPGNPPSNPPTGPTGTVCNGGKCAEIDPIVAIGTIITGGLLAELRKPDPFGPNNEIMKGLHAIGNFVQCIFGCR